MATIQRYAAFVERTLQDIERSHETGAMLVAGQVLALVLTDITHGTEDEPATQHLVQLWHQAVADDEGPLMPMRFTLAAIRATVESEG